MTGRPHPVAVGLAILAFVTAVVFVPTAVVLVMWGGAWVLLTILGCLLAVIALVVWRRRRVDSE